MSSSFIVYCAADGEKPIIKLFSSRERAAAWATSQVQAGMDTADIYIVEGIDDARKALAAAQMGEAKFLESRGRAATPDELKKAQEEELRRLTACPNELGF